MARSNQRAQLVQKAEQYQKQMRKHLENLYGSGTSSWRGPDGRVNLQNNQQSLPGAFNMQWGATPTDAQVKEFISKSGGNPYLRQLENMDLQGPVKRGAMMGIPSKPATAAKQVFDSANQRGKDGEMSLVEQLAAEYQQKTEEANAANEFRYQQGLRELTDLRARGLNQVANYGGYEAERTKENYDTAIQEQLQLLADRGLGNDTIGVAFKEKNARDRELALQNLSERVDDRTAQYDRNYTNDLVNFVERRNDVAPDFRELYALAQQYGQSGDGQGYEGALSEAPLTEQERALQALQQAQAMSPNLRGSQQQNFIPTPTIRGMSPWAASALANSTQNQLYDYRNLRVPEYQAGTRGIGSNAYPQRREPAGQYNVPDNVRQATRSAVPELNELLGPLQQPFRMKGVPPFQVVP